MAKIIYNVFIVFIYFIKFISCDVERNITIAQNGYYNVKEVNLFEKYLNTKPTSDLPLHYDYYPSICYGDNVAVSMDPGAGNINDLFSFYFSNYEYKSIIRIEEGHNYKATETDAGDGIVDIVCIKGTLRVKDIITIPGYLILPGGKLIVEDGGGFSFKALHNTSLVDPYNHFPGILNLDGEFSFTGIYSYNFKATVLSPNQFRVSSYVDIQTSIFVAAPNLPLLTIFTPPTYDSSSGVYTMKDSFFKDENIGQMVLMFQTKTNFQSYDDNGLVSLFMSGDSKVSIKNAFIRIHSKTTNNEYNDTTLELSSNDPTIATKVNLGSNQRFRGSLHLQFVQDAVIDNCVFLATDNSRASITLFASSLNISNSIITGKSGSNIIAQYGTELINSQNNHYYLQPTDISPQQEPPASNMDYGYEGNGIYSLSPNVFSTNDVFYGQKNAFNFNFIANRSLITGFDKDCYLPCTSESSPVSSLIQYPVDFKIYNPTFNQNASTTATSKQYLIRINNNGNQPSRIFTIKDLQLSTSTLIYANLPDSTLLLNNINSLEDFSIDGTVTKLSILNSKFKSSINNNATILSTSIQNTFFGGNLKDINIPMNQDYGSISTPYLYSNSDTLANIEINSIYPSTPYQIKINSTLNIYVNFTTSLNLNSFQCVLGNSINGEISETFGSYKSLNKPQCQFEFKPTEEGLYNLLILILADDSDYYRITYPKIYAFPRHQFYSGLYFSNKTDLSVNNLVMITDSTSSGTSLESNNQENILSACIKPNCSISESNNLKYVTLPNTGSEGVSTTDESKPLEIEFLLNSSSTHYQIQLSFVYYQPVDDYGSPLSIYINDEAVLILETIYQESTTNNFIFYYNNSQKLTSTNLIIENRGDIYLTSITTYILGNEVIVTEPPVTLEPSSSSSMDFIKDDNDDLLYVKSVVPSVGTFIIVSIILFLLMRKFKWPIKALFSSYYYKHLGDEGTKVSFDPSDYDKYQTHSEVLAYLHGSKFCIPSSETFPLLISTARLDFGQNGGLSSLNTILHDRLVLKNQLSETVKYLLILPPYSKGIICSSSKLYGSLKPGESVEIILTLTLFCTAFFFEKIALFVEGHGHTFICINVQSNLSQLLDIQDFEFGSILGEGSSSVVYKCKWRNEDTAVKIVNFGYSKNLSREIDLIKKIKHPNVVTFLGTISNFKYLCIVTEQARYGSLHAILHKTAIKLSLIQKINVAIDIAKGCSFLHESKIIHRDLKPSNILIFNIEDSGVCAKISDFGSSREISSNESSMTAHVGTTIYMSNQVLEKKRYNYLTDVYSYGILLYELMTEIVPYSEMNLSWSLPRFIVSGGRPSKGLENVNEEIIDIIVNCWLEEENQRPQFKDIIERMEKLYNKLLDRISGKLPTEIEAEEEIKLKHRAEIHIQNLILKNQKIRERIFNERNGKNSLGKQPKNSIEMKEMVSITPPSIVNNNIEKNIIKININNGSNVDNNSNGNNISIDSSNNNNSNGLSNNFNKEKELSPPSATTITTVATAGATKSNKLEKVLNDVEYLFKFKENETKSSPTEDSYAFLNGETQQSKLENEEYILEIQKKEQELQSFQCNKEHELKELSEFNTKLQGQIYHIKETPEQSQTQQIQMAQTQQIQVHQMQVEQQQLPSQLQLDQQEDLKKRRQKKNILFVSNAQLKEGDIYGISGDSSFKFERTPSNEERKSTLFDYLIRIPIVNILYSLAKRYQSNDSIQIKNKYKNQLQHQHQLQLQNKREDNDLIGSNQEIYNVDYVINPKIGHLLKQLAKTTNLELQIIDQTCSNNPEYQSVRNDNIQIGYIPNKEPIKALPGIKSFQKFQSSKSNEFKNNKLRPITFIPDSPLESHPPYFNIPTRRKYDDYLKSQLYQYITKNKKLECNIDITNNNK